jgi:hypothetical protein
MSFRRLISVGVLAASAAVLPALPGQAAGPSTGSCNGSYPSNAPVLSLDVSPRTLTAGQSVVAFGDFKKNQCGIKGAKIRIEAQRLVNGKASGGYTLVRTVTTTSHGTFAATLGPLHNENLRARFLSAGGFPTTVSNAVKESVRTRITEAASKGAGCTITLSGATTPTKSHHAVTIQKRGAKGHFHGWTTFAKTTTNRSGHYSVTKTATCGKAYNLSALIGSDSTNLAGRSATIFGIKPAK